jgi:hypothetical protein
MNTKPGRVGRTPTALIVIALAAASTAACSSQPAPVRASVPAAFRHACGHPGAKVTVTHLPVTIRHSSCDLTGVTIAVRGGAGAVVPDPGEGVTGIADPAPGGSGSEISVTVDKGTQDVTVAGTLPGDGS